MNPSSFPHLHALERAPEHCSLPYDLILVRGLPGSGKSTMAKVLSLVGYQHFEADQYFVRDGRYCYDRSQIRDAHEWCQQQTRASLARGEAVVVSNTFTRLVELEPYLTMSKRMRVIEAHGRWRNIHGVPEHTLAAMAQRWEPLPEWLTSSSATGWVC